MTYRSAMVNGPFAIIVGKQFPIPSMIGLTDRKKLRPEIAAQSTDGNTVFLASEEAAIRSLVLDPRFEVEYDDVWMPMAGTPVIAQMGEGIIRYGTEKPFEGYKLSITNGLGGTG